jgi:hypothetical protein
MRSKSQPIFISKKKFTFQPWGKFFFFEAIFICNKTTFWNWKNFKIYFHLSENYRKICKKGVSNWQSNFFKSVFFTFADFVYFIFAYFSYFIFAYFAYFIFFVSIILFIEEFLIAEYQTEFLISKNSVLVKT